MENEKGLYLAFKSESYYFLLPLSWVKIVRDGKDTGELPVLDFSALLKDKPDLKEKKYLIVIANDGVEFGILAEHVLELCEIEDNLTMQLREPVINEKNRYLSSAVLMGELDKGEKLAYILNPEILYTICMDRVQGGL